MQNLLIKSPLHLNCLQVAIDHLREDTDDLLSGAPKASPQYHEELKERLNTIEELQAQLKLLKN